VTTIFSSRTQKQIGTVAYYAVNVVLVIAFLVPFLWTLSTALKPRDQVLTYPPRWIPRPVTFDNFKRLWNIQDGAYRRYTLNSFVVACTTTLLVVTLSTLAGYGFSRMEFPGKVVLFTVLLSTMMIPYQSILVPLFVVMKKLGLLNTYWSMTIIYSTFQLPLSTFIMRNAFDSIPKALAEAAALDGSSSLTTFRKIALPLVGPGIATVVVLVFMWSWNEFLTALIFTTSQSLRTLPVGLSDFVANYTIDWNLLCAGGIYSSLPVMILFVFLQKYFVEAMTSGAVK